MPSIDRFLSASGLDAPARLPDFSWALSARKDSANMQPSWFGISGAFGLFLPSADPEHRWPAERYAEFGRAMARASMMPVLAGGKDLHAFGDEVAHHAPEVVDLSGKTDHLQLAALAQEACFFVSDDAEEVHLAVSAGCAGVLIKKAGWEATAPEGRHVVTLTVGADLGEASAEFVWRTLENMGLMPAGQAAHSAPAR
ncbi:MAG: glycosyltransferase family 9 protein [Pseudomonadota bacterium]